MITLDSLTLPDELVWIDEFSWNKIRSNEKLSLSGVRNIFESKLPSFSGRPISLYGEYAWMSRDNLITLHSWADELDKNMILTMHDSRTYNVKFRHVDLPVIEYEPVINTSYPDNDTLYNISIKLEVK